MNDEGFTLIELLLVLVIISILAGLVVPRLANRSESARIAAAQADINGNLATALDLYELDAGAFPTDEQGLRALMERPTLDPIPRVWNGPYVRGGLPKDPWGNPYVYKRPSDRVGLDYDLISFGSDGIEGTDDDIRNADDADETR